MKLQNGIVLGGRKLALVVCLVMLSGAYADGLTPMYGKASGTQGNIATCVTWYSNEGMTSTANVVTPWDEGSNTCMYAVLGASKIGTSTLPDVPFYFGTDGVTIGTKVARTSYNFACNVTLTVPHLTVFCGDLMANSDHVNGTTLKGHCTFVKTSKSIDFGSTYVASARGWNLAGTYVAASDVTLNLYMTFSSATTDDGHGVGFFTCSGDFSAFKGRMFMSSKVPDKGDNVGYYEVRLQSPTALGDTSYPRTDALTLKHRAHLIMKDTVTQDGTRGITLDLADGEFACLSAASDTAWTLKAPLYGSTGTLKKVGAGTVTLAGPVEVEDIVVTNGTLVVAPGATFAADAHITVKAGGKLVSRVGTNMPVSYTLEEGGEFAFDFTVPYENGETFALDCMDMTSAAYGLQTKPIDVSLSQKMTLPINATNRLALVRFDAALGVEASDFVDVTAKTFDRLPTTWLETETVNGTNTLYLVARPAIRYTREGSDNSLDTAGNWSDAKVPHLGADYYSDTINISSTRTGGGGALASFDFGGETLTLKNGLWDYAQDFYVKELRLLGGSPMTVWHASNPNTGYSPNYWPRILRGTYEISTSATDSNPASVVLDMRTKYADLRQTLVGTGSLRISTEVRAEGDGGQGLFPVYFSGMNGDFGGRLCVTTVHEKAVMDMYVTNGLAFGGPLPVYSANAVRILPMSKTMDGAISITAMADTTVDAANRGWYMTSGTLGASNGVTFVFAPPKLSVTTKLCKTGGGTLALGCETVGGGRTFAVKEGYVKALSADCCTNLNLTVSAGAGIKADLTPVDATVAAKGLIAKSILPAAEGGTILAAVDMPEGDEPKFSAVICTVPSSQTDLSTTLKAAPLRHYTGRIDKDAETYASEGLVTYTATWVKEGFTIIFR